MSDTKIEDGGPAFPVTIGTQHDQYFASPGMSLRDWFAGQALVGLIGENAHPSSASSWGRISELAGKAFEFADAMLSTRPLPQSPEQED